MLVDAVQVLNSSILEKSLIANSIPFIQKGLTSAIMKICSEVTTTNLKFSTDFIKLRQTKLQTLMIRKFWLS